MNKKLLIILLLSAVLITLLYPFNNTYTSKKVYPKTELGKEIEKSYNYDLLTQKKLLYKLENNFNKREFKILYYAKNSNHEFKDKIISLGIKNMNSDEIMPYVMYKGIFKQFNTEQLQFLSNLNIHNQGNRQQFVKYYCQWGLFLDDELFYNGSQGKNPYTKNSFIIKKKKTEFNIQVSECSYIPPLISSI